MAPTVRPKDLFGNQARRELDTVAFPVAKGLAVLSGLREEGHRVGPVLLCENHAVLKVAVTSWPFRLDGAMTVNLRTLWCPDSFSECLRHLRFLVPEQAGRAELTDARVLYEHVHRRRRPVPRQERRTVSQAWPAFPGEG
ncbi:hypothetical protein [Streptomyces sp. NPDC056244]|uniref:hypothetical protein n=1 Tax=Streptomyces sp. NPDC056244 TaxID=3345762 RepID=UPI0035DBD0E7